MAHHKPVSTKDWYYSDLHRRLLTEHYAKHGMSLSAKIEEEFANYDWNKFNELKETNFRFELTDSKQDSKNFECGMSDSTLTATYNQFDPALKSKVIGEAELKYLLGLLKGNSDKWEEQAFLTEVH